MPKFKQLLSLNFIRVALVILILLLLDLFIENYENKLLAQPAQIRLATHEADSIQALRRQIKESRGYKIVFVGDSVVYGPAGGSRETIAFYLAEELQQKYPHREIRVFNYGYKGYGISEAFFMLNTLRRSGVDMVIFGVNFNWFNRKTVVDHINPAKASPDIFQKAQVNHLGVTLPNPGSSPGSKTISGFLSEHWALYRNRSTIAATVLGKSLAEKLYDYRYMVFDPPVYRKQQAYWQDILRPWYEKDIRKVFSPGNSKLGWINLSPANPQVGFYRLIIDLVRDEQVTPLFYVSPFNYEMYESYDKLDRHTLNKYLAELKAQSRPQETNFVDFTYAIPGKYFVDSVHMLPPGHKLLAGKLAAEITGRGLLK